MGWSCVESYGLKLGGGLCAYVARKGVTTLIYMFHCKKWFQSEKIHFISFMAGPSTAGLLLRKPASARVSHDSCAAKDSYKKKRALCIITYMLLFLIYRSCFHLTVVPCYRLSVSTLCICELIRIAENHKNKSFFFREENKEHFIFCHYAHRLKSLINPLCPLKDENWDHDNMSRL